MREVDDVQYAEQKTESYSNERIYAAQRQPVEHLLDDEFCHRPLSLFIRSTKAHLLQNQAG